MGHPVAAFDAAVAFVKVMKRSDHVSSTIMVSSNQVVPKQAEKKLRKRRELNARAAAHHVLVPRGRTRKRPTSKTTAHLLGKGQFSGSSSFHDEFDEDDDEDDVEFDKNGYVNLRGYQGGLEGHHQNVKKLELKKQKLIGFCHQFCLVFVIFSGLLVLVTLAWLHFSLRSQTRDLALALHQGLEKKNNALFEIFIFCQKKFG